MSLYALNILPERVDFFPDALQYWYARSAEDLVECRHLNSNLSITWDHYSGKTCCTRILTDEEQDTLQSVLPHLIRFFENWEVPDA